MRAEGSRANVLLCFTWDYVHRKIHVNKHVLATVIASIQFRDNLLNRFKKYISKSRHEGIEYEDFDNYDNYSWINKIKINK